MLTIFAVLSLVGLLVTLASSEERKFPVDGHERIIRADCEREGFRRIGFGECRGVIEPARGG